MNNQIIDSAILKYQTRANLTSDTLLETKASIKIANTIELYFSNSTLKKFYFFLTIKRPP